MTDYERLVNQKLEKEKMIDYITFIFDDYTKEDLQKKDYVFVKSLYGHAAHANMVQRFIRIEFSKAYVFKAMYKPMIKKSSEKMISDYMAYLNYYKSKHNGSSRYWKCPIVYFDDKPMYKVTFNGSWIEL